MHMVHAHVNIDVCSFYVLQKQLEKIKSMCMQSIEFIILEFNNLSYSWMLHTCWQLYHQSCAFH